MHQLGKLKLSLYVLIWNQSKPFLQDGTKTSHWGIFHSSHSKAKSGTEVFARKERGAPMAEVGAMAHASAGRSEVCKYS